MNTAAEEERRAAMPNNPYMFNGSRTGPRLRGGSRRQVRKTRKNRRSRKNRKNNR